MHFRERGGPRLSANSILSLLRAPPKTAWALLAGGSTDPR